MQHNDRIVQLLYRRLKGSPLSAEENQELDAWLARSEANRKVLENLSDKEWMKEAKKRYNAPGKEAGLAQLREELFAEPAVIRPIRSKRWIGYAAAAAIIGIIFITIYLVPTKQSLTTQFAQTEFNNHFENTPGGEAISTLSNGIKIPLRKKADGVLAQLSDGLQVLKQDGKLVYQFAVAQSTAGEVDYSPSPRSDQYSVNSVVLPDGSRVWLNRGSSLHFPDKFGADKRVVQLEGEAYFEIAKINKANGKERLPFIVQLPAQSNSSEACEVEVLGTHFNIYAHKGEELRTTLTEGKIRMKKGERSEVLSPGQQAVLDANGNNMAIRNDVNEEEVLAWKNNQFQFKDAPIKTFLLEIGRWYGNDFLIDTDKGAIKPISIICDRNKPLSELLNQLNASGVAHFKMDGSTIVAAP